MGNRGGFTLIELMIVVGIVGIIASVAIPSFSGYVRKVRDSEAMTHIAQMHAGLATYYGTDHVTQGATGSHNTRCIPQAGGPTPLPVPAANKIVGNFQAVSTFVALNFDPVGPVQNSYLFWNVTGVSACDIANLGSDGAYVSYSDHDGDGDLRIVAIQWTIANSTLIRNGGVTVIEDFPSPF